MLANGAVGKGHGSRALLHALKTSFVMHDSSYSCPMQLTGSKASLMQLFNRIRCESCYACYARNTLGMSNLYKNCTTVHMFVQFLDFSLTEKKSDKNVESQDCKLISAL